MTDLRAIMNVGGGGGGQFAGLLASAPPSAAPGTVSPNISFLKRYGADYDILFLHSWPDTISEGITNSWSMGDGFPGLQVPLYAMWTSTQWNDFDVNFTAHTANPMSFMSNRFVQAPTSAAAVASIGLLEALRVQLQIAWCKSVMLPNNDKLMEEAKKWSDMLRGEAGTDANGNKKGILKATIERVKGLLSATKDIFQDMAKEGFYTGVLQPPVLQMFYGTHFLRLYGVPVQCRITYKSPFGSISGYPQRADISMVLRRFWPPGVRIPTRLGTIASVSDQITQNAAGG